MAGLYDAEVEVLTARQPSMLVPWYLIASYAYHHLDTPVLSDGAFDRLCGRLLDQWSSVEHRHKYLIEPSALRAGTGYQIAECTYPGMVRGAVYRLLNHGWETLSAPAPVVKPMPAPAPPLVAQLQLF